MHVASHRPRGESVPTVVDANDSRVWTGEVRAGQDRFMHLLSDHTGEVGASNLRTCRCSFGEVLPCHDGYIVCFYDWAREDGLGEGEQAGAEEGRSEHLDGLE